MKSQNQADIALVISSIRNHISLNVVVHLILFSYNARKGFHNATGGNVTQTEWNKDSP